MTTVGGLTECCGLKRRHFLPAKQRFFMQVFRPPLQTTWVFFICANLGHKRSSLVFFPPNLRMLNGWFYFKRTHAFSLFRVPSNCNLFCFHFSICLWNKDYCLSTQAIVKSSDQVEGCLSQSFFSVCGTDSRWNKACFSVKSSNFLQGCKEEKFIGALFLWFTTLFSLFIHSIDCFSHVKFLRA